MKSCKHNLPPQSTPFVGRETETAKVVSLLDNEYCRLITLVGPGGMGKTRLALKAAEELVQADSDQAPLSYPDGVYFVSLQPVASPGQIASTIANTLDWEYYEGSNPKAELLTYLRDKSLLLILDNFEHLVTAIPLIQELLHGAPKVKMLVTSRVLLNLAGEWLFQVDGMSLPPDESGEGIETADAVKLFCQRAQRVRHDFSLSQEQDNVVRICRLVEGMPLAIELAAAWLRRLPCAEVAYELEHSLEILQSDQTGIPDRHRTMHAVFDHSWRLLSQEERDLFKALSVFRGGFLREAAEEVAEATLPLLSMLVDKSLLRVNGAGRYSIHELQRQYAAERLAESPERQAKVGDTHSSYYLRLIAHPVLSYIAEGNKKLLEAIEAEVDNVLDAWNWAVERIRISDLHKAVEGMYWFSWLSTYHGECEMAFRHAIEVLRRHQATDEHRIAFAFVLASHGSMNIWLGHNQEANEELRKSVALLRTFPSARYELGFAVGTLGWSMFANAEFEVAKSLFHEAIELDEETEQFVQLAFIYCMLGDLAQKQSEYSEYEQWYQLALKLARKIGDQRTIAHSLSDLGWLATQRGEYAKAHRYLEESLSVAKFHEIRNFVVVTLRGLGQLYEAIGKFEMSLDYLQQSLDTARRLNRSPNIAASLVSLAEVRTAQANYWAALDLYREAANLLARAPSLETQIELLNGKGNLALRMQDYDNARLYYEECLTLSRQYGHRLSTSRVLVGLGLTAMRQGQRAEATRLLLGALQEGLTIGMAPVLLDCVASAAELFAADGDTTYSAQLAALVRDHGASTAQTKQRANTLLAQIVPELVPERRERIMEGGPETAGGAIEVDIEAVARRVEAELSRLNGKMTQAAAILTEQPLIEPLSKRELEVLRMVAAGKSNREIGRELYLALGTVKSHLHHIFQKLDVQSRTQAVARGEDLNLL